MTPVFPCSLGYQYAKSMDEELKKNLRREKLHKTTSKKSDPSPTGLTQV